MRNMQRSLTRLGLCSSVAWQRVDVLLKIGRKSQSPFETSLLKRSATHHFQIALSGGLQYTLLERHIDCHDQKPRKVKNNQGPYNSNS